MNYRRLHYLYCGILFIFVILILRLIFFQVIYSDQLIIEGNKRSLRLHDIPEIRGMITDRMGRLLAVSVSAYSVWIDPKEICRYGDILDDISKWTKLSSILNISLEKLLFFIKNNESSRFLYLSRQINVDIADYIDRLNLPGVYLRKEFKRCYPAGPVAAHVVGITNIDNHGIEGIEKSFDVWLSGQSKIKVVRQDRVGRVIEDVAVLRPGLSSKNIVLSIDERLQYLAYHELNHAVNINKAESGSIVLVDINTGEILAMVNSPTYDPNNFSVADKSMMRNRVITDAFEPGSTIKPIVVIAALKNKIIEKDAVFNTLPYMINGHQIKDVVCYNKLTISEILKKSSNVGISKLALSMPVSVLMDSYLYFGVGQLTKIGLIGENRGKIYSYSRYCSEIEHAALSYGYGLMITPLQLAKIYATIGGLEVSKPLSILKIDNSIVNSTDLKTEHLNFPKDLMRTVIDMMEVTTESTDGCYRAAIKGYRVAVKTGTVKKVGSCGKYVNKYIACIAGIAPVSNPRFALVVVINDPKSRSYYGGIVAAPVFKSIMSNALKIMNVEPDFLQ